jgi:hypothetical protein
MSGGPGDSSSGSGGAAGTFGFPAPAGGDTAGTFGSPAPAGGATAGTFGFPAPAGGGTAGTFGFPPSPGSDTAGTGAPLPNDGTAGFGVPSPPPPFCDSMAKKALPYAIGPDFPTLFPLNAPGAWTIEPGFDCNQSVFPDAAPADAGAGDGGASDGGWSATPGAGDAGAPASCTVFRYDPDGCVAVASSLPNPDGGPPDIGDACWAGVIFTPAGFGAPGVCIAPGATTIHFKARASRDGARVKFGSIRPGLGSTEFFILLTTAWADYTVSIPAGEDYNNEPAPGNAGVWNGFSLVAEYQDHPGGTYIFVSDIVWEAQ